MRDALFRGVELQELNSEQALPLLTPLPESIDWLALVNNVVVKARWVPTAEEGGSAIITWHMNDTFTAKDEGGVEMEIPFVIRVRNNVATPIINWREGTMRWKYYQKFMFLLDKGVKAPSSSIEKAAYHAALYAQGAPETHRIFGGTPRSVGVDHACWLIVQAIKRNYRNGPSFWQKLWLSHSTPKIRVELRLGRNASRPERPERFGRNASAGTLRDGPSTWPREAEAGWPAGSEQTHALFAERDPEEQDNGSWPSVFAWLTQTTQAVFETYKRTVYPALSKDRAIAAAKRSFLDVFGDWIVARHNVIALLDLDLSH